MEYCHEHNRPVREEQRPRPYGLRLSLPPNDPMRPLLGDDWFKCYWFATAEERERKIREFTDPFPYYRKGDQPSFVIETLEARPETQEPAQADEPDAAAGTDED